MGYLTTITFIKKRIFFTNKLEYYLDNISNLSNKKSLSFEDINPIKINKIKLGKNLKNRLIYEYYLIESIRNDTFSFWQNLINEISSYALKRYSFLFDSNSDLKQTITDDIQQILSINLINGLNLLNYPQRHTLYNRLKTYIDNYFSKLIKEKSNEIHFSEFNKNNFEETKDELNNVHLYINKQERTNIFELDPESLTLNKEKNIKYQNKFWKDVIKQAKKLKLFEEEQCLKEIFQAIKKERKKGVFDFYRDYNKRKIKGSIGLLIKFVEAKYLLQKL